MSEWTPEEMAKIRKYYNADTGHAFVPELIAEIERLQAQVAELQTAANAESLWRRDAENDAERLRDISEIRDQRREELLRDVLRHGLRSGSLIERIRAELEVVLKHGKLYVESKDGRTSGPIEKDDASWLLRAIACVNAIAGIADPAAQVERWKAMEALLRKGNLATAEALAAGHKIPVEIAALAKEWTPDV